MNSQEPTMEYVDNDYLDTYHAPETAPDIDSEDGSPNIADQMHHFIHAALAEGKERAVAYQFYVVPMRQGTPKPMASTVADTLGMTEFGVRGMLSVVNMKLKAHAKEHGGISGS